MNRANLLVSLRLNRNVVVGAVIGVLICLLRPAAAQTSYHPLQSSGSVPGSWYSGFSWGAFDPRASMISRITAQATLLRSQGFAAVQFALARSINATSYDKELDNWMKQLRVHWDRKILREKKRMELDYVRQVRKMKYLNDQKWRNHRRWEAIENHPSLVRSRIRTGEALNFLLERLAVTTLPYEYDPQRSRFSDQVLEDLKLDPSWFGDIRLRQGALVFPANRTVSEEIDLWPFLLRWEAFEDARESFTEARRAVVRESEEKDRASVASIRRMQDALYHLTNEFYASSDVKEWVQKHRRYTTFSQTELFLRRLDREIAEIEKTGDIRALRTAAGYDPKEAGGNLIAFLSFLNRNGIQFAPAEPGKEEAYHRLFFMMRALYLTVADLDESTRPVEPERAKE